MDVRKLSETYSVAPQIQPDEVKALADAGFQTIMCNRPDGEEYGQPDFDEIKAAAETAGLSVCWIPILSGGVTQDALDQFRSALDDMPGPVLAYCRSGTRCTMLWTIAKFGDLPDKEILSATQSAGYDMSALLHQLRQMQG